MLRRPYSLRAPAAALALLATLCFAAPATQGPTVIDLDAGVTY